MPLVHRDGESVAYRFPNLVVNLLAAGAAPELIGPAPVGAAGTPARMLLTLQVDDVDEFAAHLRALGVAHPQRPAGPPMGAAHSDHLGPQRPLLGALELGSAARPRP